MAGVYRRGASGQCREHTKRKRRRRARGLGPCRARCGHLRPGFDPKDAFSWGLRLGFLVNDNSAIGFLFDQQSTELEIGGTATVKLGDQSVRNYHGYFAYNFGDSDASARPYILFGLGATQHETINVNVAGTQRDINGNTNFPGTGALGVKIFPSPKFGIRLEARWTPTYIKSDADGWWCDPYWGCYVFGDALYSNQFELSGGITLRF